MDFDQAKKDITQWIVDFVEQPHPLLNGWAPCPYARQTRVNNRVDIRLGRYNPIDDLKHVVMDNLDVVILVYGRERWSADEFNELVKIANMVHLNAQGLFALTDHPDDVELVNSVIMNQGTYAMVFVQSADKLNQAAKQLADRGFYNSWPEQYLTALFEGRQDPR